MNDQTQSNLNFSPEEKPKRRRFFVVVFLVIIVLGGTAGFFIWKRNFGLEVKLGKQNLENYKKYLDWQNNYEKAMREDTYGGQTPEETLQMFIEALKKGDIELASKYFALNTNEKSEYYLTRKEWEEGLREAKRKDTSLSEILTKLSKVKLTFKSKDGATFKLYDDNGELEVLVEMKFNQYSGVWKITSL